MKKKLQISVNDFFVNDCKWLRKLQMTFCKWFWNLVNALCKWKITFCKCIWKKGAKAFLVGRIIFIYFEKQNFVWVIWCSLTVNRASFQSIINNFDLVLQTKLKLHKFCKLNFGRFELDDTSNKLFKAYICIHAEVLQR